MIAKKPKVKARTIKWSELLYADTAAMSSKDLFPKQKALAKAIDDAVKKLKLS